MGGPFPIAVIAIAAVLSGCDSHARFAPEFLRMAGPVPQAEEEPPDAAKIVRDNLATIFVNPQTAKNVAVSPPVKARFGWTTCLRVQVNAISGVPIGTQTYLLAIERDKPGLRQRVEPTHACASEIYTPI